MSTQVPPPAPGAIQLAPSEELTYSTVRIVCSLPDGTTSTGTGFIFAFLRDGERAVPAIVTNRHVVEGAISGSFVFTRSDATGAPIQRAHMNIQFSRTQAVWINHPSDDVDLCIMPIAPILQMAQQEQHRLMLRWLDDRMLPSASELADLVALEDILMIGYPNGIWDSVNNMPILRRGITATHPNLDYEGRREFVIDSACFPGSSGSPVFLFNQGSWADRRGNLIAGSRIRLLGILYAGPQSTATGEIRIVTIPTQQRAIAVSSIPNNLGFVIKSSRLREFEPVLRSVTKSAS